MLEARLTLSVFPYSRVLIHEGPHAWAHRALTFAFHASARLSNTFSRLEQQRYSFLTFTNETCCRISRNYFQLLGETCYADIVYDEHK